jgi:hypothetical protein
MGRDEPFVFSPTPGAPSDDAWRIPTLTGAGGLQTESNEGILYSGRHRVLVARDTRDGAQQVVVEFGRPAEVLVSGRRIAYVWRELHRDRSAGSFFERRIELPLLERDPGFGKLTAAGHVRVQWMGAIFTHKREGRLQINMVHDNQVHFLTLSDFESPARTLAVMREVASRAAAERLLSRKGIKSDERAVLERISRKEEDPVDVGWGLMYPLAGLAEVGHHYPDPDAGACPTCGQTRPSDENGWCIVCGENLLPGARFSRSAAERRRAWRTSQPF